MGRPVLKVPLCGATAQASFEPAFQYFTPTFRTPRAVDGHPGLSASTCNSIFWALLHVQNNVARVRAAYEKAQQ